MSVSPLFSPETSLSLLPDVAEQSEARALGRIDRVGMERIELPIAIRNGSGQRVTVPGEADVFVSLDREDARGIHMSRLFLALQEILGKEELTPGSLAELLDTFVGSHATISQSSHVKVRWSHLLSRDSLASGLQGWKSYPVEISASLERGALRLELGTSVVYSSTCPCSAALSREIIAEAFQREFGAGAIDASHAAAWLRSEAGLPATPHSQRSFAELRLVLDPHAASLPVVEVIDAVEEALGTPVQAAVKREDEQAFAALNGANLMFCEDAARIVKRTLDEDTRIADYHVKIRHEESLHPHDAVAVITKGLPGGLRA